MKLDIRFPVDIFPLLKEVKAALLLGDAIFDVLRIAFPPLTETFFGMIGFSREVPQDYTKSLSSNNTMLSFICAFLIFFFS